MAATEKIVSGTAPGLRRDAIGLIYLYRTNPGRITDVGLPHLDAVEEVAGE